MPNIFLVSSGLGPEDRFTAHWHYLLDNYPELGQRVADYLADAGGLSRSRYLGAEDHPVFTREDQPDFLIRCEDYDLVCEHKIDADLQQRQLERYLALTRPGRTLHVVFIANQADIELSQPVLEHPGYLRPTGKRSYFLWEDLFHLVKATPGRLAAEFVAYMVSMDMEPWASTGAWSDPLTDTNAAGRLKALYGPLKKRLRGVGRVKKPDTVGLGFQIQRPLSNIHLFYLLPDRPGRHAAHSFSGRGLYLMVYAHKGSPSLQVLPAFSGPLSLGAVDASVVTNTPPISFAGLSKRYAVMREYALPLGEVMLDSDEQTVGRMESLIRSAIQHLEAEGA